VSFNGTSNIDLPGVNQIGNQNTTGSAASLTTARLIGGVSFNGTANINLPGVNQVGNQNTTGSAASLTTARNFTIGATARSFNGTANVSWSLADIGVNNGTLTLATSGIATGSQTFTANQSTNATFTVNVPATNLTYSSAATTGTVNSSTGANVTIPAATTSLAGLMTNADKTKLDGIQAGAQVNVATNLSWTNGTTAGPTVNSSTGTNATMPTASATISGAMTTGTQTFAGAKTFSSAVTLSTAGTATTHAVRADRTLTAGTGLTGGGNLTANRTFNIDIATQGEAEAGTNNTKVMTPLRLRNALNATGTAPVFACRAWVNFNGVSTASIRSSGNVSSVTRAGVGDYTINFSTAMQDANYAISGTARGIVNHPVRAISLHELTDPAASSVRIACGLTGSATVTGRFEDSNHIFIAIHR
jgi:hypothetical protein